MLQFLLDSVWNFFASPEGYIHRNWSELGGAHFIAVCTALNLAVVGWKDFRKQVWEAETRMVEKISSLRLSLAETDRNALRIVGDLILGPLLFVNKWGWRITYVFVIIASAVGLLMLWAAVSCPYDILLLLLPSFCQASLTLMTVLAIMFWSFVMKRGLRASQRVDDFLKNHPHDKNDP